jgi:rRNA maturation endonuclease Nob1
MYSHHGQGTWTLKCQNCGKTFELEVKPNERVIIYAQTEPCPHCGLRPIESKVQPSWHHVIGFRNIRTD